MNIKKEDILKRDNYQCRKCKSSDNLDVYPTDDGTDCETLCDNCKFYKDNELIEISGFL